MGRVSLAVNTTLCGPMFMVSPATFFGLSLTRTMVMGDFILNSRSAKPTPFSPPKSLSEREHVISHPQTGRMRLVRLDLDGGDRLCGNTGGDIAQRHSDWRGIWFGEASHRVEFQAAFVDAGSV